MKSRLTICACRWRRVIPQELIDTLRADAEGEGREVVVVDDLCRLAEQGDGPTLAALDGTAVAACHERAVRSLLRWRGIEVGEVIDLRRDAGDVGPGDDAWFPVIDKERCTECGRCHDFCPFGVYDMVEDRVKVVHPANCKNNCPACARNCPSEAVIFPKYGRSPINGGEDREEEALRVDHAALYAGALRARLMERRATGVTLYGHGHEGG